MVLRYGWKTLCATGLLAFTLASCADDGDGAGPQHNAGELGLAYFSWSCVSDGDLGCEGDGRFPSLVAVGSTYRPSFTLSSRVPDEIDVGWVEIASPARATPVSNGRLTADRQGSVTLMALDINGAVVDFTTIEQRPIADLDLRLASSDPFGDCEGETDGCTPDGDSDSASLVFQPESTVRLRVEPLTAAGEPLVGDIHYEWMVRPLSSIVIDEEDGNEIEFYIERPTEFEITVTGGGVAKAFHYRTADEGPRRPRPGSMDSGTDGDSSGTETDFGSDSGTDTGTGTTGGDTDGGSSTGGAR